MKNSSKWESKGKVPSNTRKREVISFFLSLLLNNTSERKCLEMEMKRERRTVERRERRYVRPVI
jgi:hypothetical protein